MATPLDRSINLLDEARKPFLNVADSISDALIYLDAAFGEAAYYDLGLSFVHGLGAKAVCALESACSEDSVVAQNGGTSRRLERLTVFTGRLLNESHRHILRALRSHKDVRYCTIFCAVSEAAHADYPGGLLSHDAYSQYEQLLREDLAATVKQAREGGSKKSQADSGREAAGHRGTDKREEGWQAWNDEEQDAHQKGSSGADREVGTFGELSRVLREARASQEHEESWETGSNDWEEKGPLAENTEKLQISVHYFPTFYCALAPGAFVLPSSSAVAQAPIAEESSEENVGNAADCLGRGLPAVGAPVGGDEVLPPGIPLLAHWLGGVLAQLELRPELFSLGPTSRAVAKAMTELPTIETRSTAAVVLVDRTLDLLIPASHADNLLDRIAAALPQRASDHPLSTLPSQTQKAVLREPLDFRVPLGDLFPSEPLMSDDFHEDPTARGRQSSRVGVTGDDAPSTSNSDVQGSNGVSFGGALFQPSDAQATERMDSFLSRRNARDALMALRRALQEAVRSEKLPAPRIKLGAIGPSEILSLLAPLEEQPRLAFKHRALIQLARASAHALDAPFGPRWETLASTEKIMALSAAEGTQSLAVQLKELAVQNKTEVASGETSVINLRDILTLAVVAYALAGELRSTDGRRSSTGGPVEGPFSWEDELELQDTIVDAILAGPQPVPLSFLDGLGPSLEALWAERKDKTQKGIVPEKRQPGAESKSQLEETEEHSEEGGPQSSQQEGEETGSGWEDTHDGWDADWDAEESASPAALSSDALGASNDEAAYSKAQLRLEVKDRVEEVFRKLRLVSTARQRLHGFRYLDQNSGGLGATCTCLLKQLVAKICAREEIPDLEHASSAVKKLLQTGLGRFGFQTFQNGPKPWEHKVVFIFVVGGITLGEIREVRDVLLPAPGQSIPGIIVGGTTILGPEKLHQGLFER